MKAELKQRIVGGIVLILIVSLFAVYFLHRENAYNAPLASNSQTKSNTLIDFSENGKSITSTSNVQPGNPDQQKLDDVAQPSLAAADSNNSNNTNSTSAQSQTTEQTQTQASSMQQNNESSLLSLPMGDSEASSAKESAKVTADENNNTGSNSSKDQAVETSVPEKVSDNAIVNYDSLKERSLTKITSDKPLTVKSASGSTQTFSSSTKTSVSPQNRSASQNELKILASQEKKNNEISLNVMNQEVQEGVVIPATSVDLSTNQPIVKLAPKTIAKNNTPESDHFVTTPSPSSVSEVSSGTHWIIQIASYSEEANAERMVQKLRSKGLSPYTQESYLSGGKIIRVYLGPLSLSQAEQIKGEYQLPGIIKKGT